MIPLIALIGSGVDLSVAYTTRTKLQNACDAAVLAGRQSMSGVTFKQRDKDEAEKFFEFNFPANTHGAQNVQFEIEQNAVDTLELLASASLELPTTMMSLFGFESIPIEVSCNAKRDQADNDIVLVLDVTGSMADPPSGGGGTKIEALRDGANGLYRALEGDTLSTTRYGIVPYSHTVNVARSLRNRDFLRRQSYVDVVGNTITSKLVHINNSTWNHATSGGASGNMQAFRTSGDGCIEERASVGESTSPIEILESVSLSDVDSVPQNANDTDLQFGRYDPPMHTNTGTTMSNGVRFYRVANRWVQTGCPSESSTLREYFSEGDFSTAIGAATARVTGGTYHDIGMLWGMRFISRNGFFDSENPEFRGTVPVRQHIVFMTDGKLDTGANLYSAFGIQSLQGRVQVSDDLDNAHIERFASACSLAKSMGITVWVIALDVTDTDDIRPCATSEGHFYISDGSDLEEVFTAIGVGIGNLRLTR